MPFVISNFRGLVVCVCVCVCVCACIERDRGGERGRVCVRIMRERASVCVCVKWSCGDE